MSTSSSAGWKRRVFGILLFGISFGYVEAAVVIYLRPNFYALRERFYPQVPRDELFPLLTARQVREAGPEEFKLLGTELGREAATLLMLAAVALAVAKKFSDWFAAFLMAFGAWDIAFYAFLKLLIAWPASLLTWDILFLLPVPWTGPVLAPVLVSLTMIGAGLVYFRRESIGRPMRLRGFHWAGAGAGGLMILAAFTWDYRNLIAGGMPQSFHWPLFGLGEAVALLAFLHAFREREGRNNMSNQDSRGTPVHAGQNFNP